MRGIISFGICGALSPDLHPGACIVASEIIAEGATIATDPGWSGGLRRRLPDAVTGAIAGTPFVLQNASEKSRLYARTGALAADMESHIAAEIAQRRGVPFACLRAVADSAATELPAAALVAVTEHGTVDYRAVLFSLLKRPDQIGALLRVGRETRVAFASLFRCLDMLGGRLAGPDFGEPALDMR